MSLPSHWFVGLIYGLGTSLAVLGIICGATSSVADSPSWKIPADPEIVNFKRANAEVVTQTLVAPPFSSGTQASNRRTAETR